MKKFLINIILILIAFNFFACATHKGSVSSRKFDVRLGEIVNYEEYYNQALRLEQEEKYNDAYILLIDKFAKKDEFILEKLNYTVPKFVFIDAFFDNYLIPEGYGPSYGVKLYYGSDNDIINSLLESFRGKVEELFFRIQTKLRPQAEKLEQENIVKIRSIMEELEKLVKEGKIDEARELILPFREAIFPTYFKPAFEGLFMDIEMEYLEKKGKYYEASEVYYSSPYLRILTPEARKQLEEYAKQDRAQSFLSEIYPQYKKMFPRFLSYLRSEGIDIFDAKTYVQLQDKYPGFQLEYLETYKDTILSKYDEFELYDICELLDEDLRSSLFNGKVSDIFNVEDNKCSIEVSPNFANKTYTYHVSRHSPFLKFNKTISSVLRLFRLCEYHRFEYYCEQFGSKYSLKKARLNMRLLIVLEDGEKYYSSTSDSYIYIEICGDYSKLEDTTWEINSNITNIFCSFQNIPYKKYQSVELVYDNLFLEEVGKTSSSNSSYSSSSNKNSSNSRSTAKDLFGSIICEDCGKNLALYDCFDPVKNVRISLCRPCLRNKEQEYNEGYKKVLSDIKNL